MSLVPSGVMGRAPLTGQALAQQRGKQQARNRMGTTFMIFSSYCTFMHFMLSLNPRFVRFASTTLVASAFGQTASSCTWALAQGAYKQL